MALIERPKDAPSGRQLIEFSLLCAVILPAIGWWWSASGLVIGLLCLIGLSLVATSLAAPRYVALLFSLLMLVTLPVGMIVGEVALLSVFCLVFFPISLVFRILNRNRLELDFDAAKESYWHPKAKKQSMGQYYRQS